MELKPCPFCKHPPVMRKHRAPSHEEVKQGLKAGAWAQVACVSDDCAMRVVETHRCGSQEEAARIWNDRVD